MKCPGYILTLIILCLSPSLWATTSYCSSSIDRSFIRLKYGSLGQAQLNATAPAQVETIISEFNSNWVFNQEKQHSRSIGFNFQYTIVDLDSIDAMTNGHLHTWDFPFEGRLSNTDSKLFYNITPTISVSSNTLKNPDLIGSNGLQINTGLVYKKNFSASTAWLLGFGSDHRFGSYKAYPVIGVCMQPSPNWILQLAVPDFSIQKSFNTGLSLKFFAEPVGNRWQVFSKDKTRESTFTYDAIAVGLSAKWRINASVNVGLAIENQSSRRFNFTLDDNSVVSAKAESSRGVMFSAEVLF